MKRLLFCLLLLCTWPAAAQSDVKPVDREAVQRAVTDPNGPAYYPKLLARFAAFDSTLTNEDYRHLYYGFVFQPGYEGYMDHKKSKIHKLLDARDFAGAAALSDSVLAQIPVSLNANFLKGFALYMADKGNPRSRSYQRRYLGLRDAILSTGDGRSCETAFKTIFVSDEYDILYNYFEVEQSKGQSLEGHCDRLHIKPNKQFPASSMYFDTSETLLSLRSQWKNKK